MFGSRYFGSYYFGRRYFGPVVPSGEGTEYTYLNPNIPLVFGTTATWCRVKAYAGTQNIEFDVPGVWSRTKTYAGTSPVEFDIAATWNKGKAYQGTQLLQFNIPGHWSRTKTITGHTALVFDITGISHVQHTFTYAGQQAIQFEVPGSWSFTAGGFEYTGHIVLLVSPEAVWSRGLVPPISTAVQFRASALSRYVSVRAVEVDGYGRLLLHVDGLGDLPNLTGLAAAGEDVSGAATGPQETRGQGEGSQAVDGGGRASNEASGRASGPSSGGRVRLLWTLGGRGKKG